MMGSIDEAFESHRGRLFGIAYRMIGSAAEAEDIVQEAFLRWRASPHDDVRSVQAYLTTIVTRLSLDHLKSARTRRESYVGPWLPEPIRSDRLATDSPSPVDPESISLAFLVLLESLTPLERAVYLLHEVFEYDHGEIASMLSRSEPACRKLLQRARTHVASRRPRFASSKDDHRRLLDAFLSAALGGDVAGLQKLLSDDAMAWSDGGGKTFAARRPIEGAEAVARMYAGIGRKATPDVKSRIEELNGWPMICIYVGEQLVTIIDLETDGTSVRAVRAVLNPDKLAAVDRH